MIAPTGALRDERGRLLGIDGVDPGVLNDDRVGRTLLRLFDADRASLMTELVLGAVEKFSIDYSELHNDSTSITFSGAYRSGTGAPRGGKATPVINFGHSKDHRADLKQLVWILTVSADGAVPLACRVEAGNTNDGTTHVTTWDALVALVERSGFLYVADTKLANRDAMDHTAIRGWRFVTVLPRTRKEDGFFRQWIQDNVPTWTEAPRHRSRGAGEPDNVWGTTPSPVRSAEGYRIVWAHSSVEGALDAESSLDRIQRAVAALADPAKRVAGPRPLWHTRVAVEQVAERWVHVEVIEADEETVRKEHRRRVLSEEER